METTKYLTLDTYLDETFIRSFGFFTPPLGPAGVGVALAGVGVALVGTVGDERGSALGGGTPAGGDAGRTCGPTSSAETFLTKTSASASAFDDGEASRGGESTSITGPDSAPLAGDGVGRGLAGGEPRRNGERDPDSSPDRAFLGFPTFTPPVDFTGIRLFFDSPAAGSFPFPFLFGGTSRQGASSPGAGGLEEKDSKTP